MKLRHVVITLIGVGLFSFSIISTVNSLPRLAVEHATACKSCHISPGGGGMRTEFGNHAVAFSERTLPQTQKHLAGKYRSPRVSESLTIGFDARYLILDDWRIFRMQTDFFVNFEPMENFNYQIRFWENGVIENYALVFIGDQKFWLKAGRFAPTFGLKNADHKSFNRERVGYGSNVYLDGLSLGADLNGLVLSAELFNPNDRATGNLNLIKTGYLAPVSYMYGGSIRFSEEVDGKTGPFRPAKSLFAGLAYDRFSLLGELDLVGENSDTLIFYSSLTGRIEYGLHLLAEYNFFDGNRDLADEVEAYFRFSVEFFPIPFVQLRPSYTRYTRGPLVGENNFFFQLYMGY